MSALAARRDRSFPQRRAFRGTPFFMRAAFTFPARALRQIGGAGAKARFCLRENFLEKSIQNFTFTILHFTFGHEILRRVAPQDDRGENVACFAPPPCHPERSGEREVSREVEWVSENVNRPCHFDLVVARLCCQHFAEWQNARLARRLLLFPKISLRCDFREPCLLTEWRNLARKRISKQTPSLFMPSPFLRGKVARAAFAARDE